ncbi:MAG: acetyl-CoA carboxylase biotin carboxyl carrier protein [Planctomycetota bacterium]|nr:acetyl-CoA carboxylase biotin carboxyl carrier protein [Planctomycetota bacterium]
MSNESPSEVQVFNVDTIKQFVELMNDHELTEIDLQQADQKIRLCKKEALVAASPAAAQAAAPLASAPRADAGVAAAPVDDANIVTINSPMVGTFYSKPKPESEDYVKVGDSVNPDTCVCLLEAMKTFNELPAGVSGKIVAVLVQNEEPIDVNKPLFKVDTSA